MSTTTLNFRSHADLPGQVRPPAPRVRAVWQSGVAHPLGHIATRRRSSLDYQSPSPWSVPQVTSAVHAARERRLVRAGYTVVRLSGEGVLREPLVAVGVIVQALERLR